MGTCNYTTQRDFDLYIYDIDFEDEIQYQFDMDYTYNDAKALARRLSEDLMFYKLTIKGGYYSGIQTFVEPLEWYTYYDNIEHIDNEDSYYYFDMCRSKALRKHQAEVNKINKKLLPLFEKELGFDHIRCIGVFSNGEAIYERVA